MLNIIKKTMLSFLILTLFACANNEESAEEEFINDLVRAYETAQTAVEAGNFRRAIGIFESIQSRFPFSDLSNQIQLELSIESQKQVIEKQKQDFSKILKANKKMNTLVNNLQKDINALDKRFNKGARDFGKLANEKPKLVEKLVNRGSVRAGRCIEIAGGSPLTEKEINATKKSEINTECPSIANPNYESY